MRLFYVIVKVLKLPLLGQDIDPFLVGEIFRKMLLTSIKINDKLSNNNTKTKPLKRRLNYMCTYRE